MNDHLGKTKGPNDTVKEHRGNFFGREPLLPHETSSEALSLRILIHARKDSILTTGHGQISDKVHSPYIISADRDFDRLQ